MIILFLIAIFVTSTAFAEPTTVTFSITSSAVTSAPNLRIAKMKPAMALAPIAMQGVVIDSVENYYLTKSTVVTFNTLNTKLLRVQTDQDTKIYFGTDLTNYLVHYNGVPDTYIFR